MNLRYKTRLPVWKSELYTLYGCTPKMYTLALSPRSSLCAIHFLVLLSCFEFCRAVPSPFACYDSDVDATSLPFCQRSLSMAERVKDLIGRLTLDEKVGLLVNNAAPVPRLGIKGYEWWSEALHGVSNVGPGTKFDNDIPAATSFPQVITTAASFNISLWEAIGEAVSDEARAMHNEGSAGLTYWSPNVNIFRDPRWGRGQETPGEDPLVVGKYATAYVRGLQGYDGQRLKVAACCKHFTAYDLDNWNGVDRFHFNAMVSKQDLEDTFNLPFKTCVKEGNVASVMCSYNQLNGIPTCADSSLLRRTIRDAWLLNGYIVSDCDSVGVFYESQHYTSTPEEAAADAVKAGLDLDCGPFLAVHTAEAVRRGLLSETDVDGALANTFTVQMRLGLFDNEADAQPFAHLGRMDVCAPAHKQLALEAARQGIVLLKNSGSALPLSRYFHRTIAVIGPNSDATVTMIGNYAGVACEYTSPLQGINKYARTVHQMGCADIACTDNANFEAAIAAASRADATVLIMGLDQSLEAESRDRLDLFLPGRQEELVISVATVSAGPVVLVLMSGGPVDVSFANDNPKIRAIVWAGYPGEAGGAAIADVVFGANNPGGKLPMSWYPQEYLSGVPMTTMAMRPDPETGYPGRTYRFYKSKTVYAFGHGLSYTQFSYEIAQAPTTVDIPLRGHRNVTPSGAASVRVTRAKCGGLSVAIGVDVRNVGRMDGSDTVLAFASSSMTDWAPHKQLVAFEKVEVPVGGQRRVHFRLHVCKLLSVVDRLGNRRIPLGEHRLQIGDAKHTLSLRPIFNS